MQTAHLDTIRLKLAGTVKLLQSDVGTALWLAHELSAPGQPFEGMVFYGGDKKGFKKAGIPVPPIAINSLKGAIQATLRESRELESLYVKPDESGILGDDDRLKNAELALTFLSRYWNAVRHAFPEAWQDKTNYILLQSIGLTGFSQLGAKVIDERISNKAVGQDQFEMVLKHISSKVDLGRANWLGMAGLAGARRVFNTLRDAANEDFDRTLILSQITPPVQSALGE